MQSWMSDDGTLNQINNIFCDIRCMVRYAFHMTDHREQMQTRIYQFGSLFHHLNDLFNQLIVQIVNVFVSLANFTSGPCILLDKCVDAVMQHAESFASHFA